VATQSEGSVALISNAIKQRGLLNEKRKNHKGLQEGIIGTQERNIDAGYDGSDIAGVSRRFGVGREVQGCTSLDNE
jgi:hypothetical protein